MILVTGGAGFIGSNFILDWFAEPSSGREGIVNLDALTYAGSAENLASLYSDPRYCFVQGDICDGELVNKLLNSWQPRAIVHFAAESHVDRSIHSSSAFVKTNILGTATLLESARHYWSTLRGERRDVFRFHHVSTDEVYGSLTPAAASFSETHPYDPRSPYSASKAASDHLVQAWHHTYGLPTLITNCSNNYGPYHFPEKLIPLVISNALLGKPLPLYGDGLQIRDWLYVKDHCAAIRTVLSKGRVGTTYNIGGGCEKTNIEIVTTICRILDAVRPDPHGSYSRLITFVPDRPGHDRRYAVDSQKIQNELGWYPKESLEAGLRKTIAWYLENQTWLDRVRNKNYRA